MDRVDELLGGCQLRAASRKGASVRRTSLGRSAIRASTRMFARGSGSRLRGMSSCCRSLADYELRRELLRISSRRGPTRNGDLDPRRLYQYSLVRAWWRCALDSTHEWESTIAARVKRGTGCPFCAGRAAGPTTSLAALYPDVAVEWHPEKNAPLSPGDVVPGAAANVWWRCRLGHEWQSRICERTRRGRGCRLCFLERHRAWLAENNRLRAKLRRDAGA